jgi:hypothetical protein
MHALIVMDMDVCFVRLLREAFLYGDVSIKFAWHLCPL